MNDLDEKDKKAILARLGLDDEAISNTLDEEKFNTFIEKIKRICTGEGDSGKGGENGAPSDSDEEEVVGNEATEPVEEIIVEEPPTPEPKTVSYPFEKIRYTDKDAFAHNANNWVNSRIVMLRKRGIIP